MGERVVKWYSAILGFAALIIDRMVDFPALGIPTSPASASILSSNSTSSSLPFIPLFAKFGVCLVGVAK